jgi:TolB-like protein
LERRLAAILAADVVGYSRLMGEDETGTLERLKSLRRELVQPRIAERKGRIVKLMGDGLLAEFPSVVEAVQCAVDIQKSMIGREAELPDERRIRLRIGVNLGDIIVEGSDIYGDGVNVAARLEGLADPDGICVSGTVFEHVKSKVVLDFADLGEQQVKNIDQPVQVYRIALDSEADASEAAGTSTVSAAVLELPDKPSIAVLPFTNMSGDPEQEYFSDGITEDIITELARFNSLFVIARNSSFQYKGRSVKIQDVGHELGVHYIVEGSVRRASNRVRITAQLIEAATGNHVWAERYDRELKDIFAVQDEVVREIATAVPGQLEAVAFNRIRQRSDHDLTAYELVLRGERIRNQNWGTPDAIPLFEQAIEADPHCARAYAQLANWHAYSIFAHYAPADEARQLTRSLGEKALQIEPSNPIILAFLAEAYLMVGDLEFARRCIDKAIKINPNHHYVMVFAATVLAWLGEVDEALRWRELHARHDPLSVASAAEADFEVYFLAERYEDAIATIDRWHSVPPHMLAETSAAYAQAGRLEEAQALREQFENSLPTGYTIDDHVAAVLSLCAQQKHRDQWLEGFRNAGFDV